MHKTIKVFISLCIIFTSYFICSFAYAKYVIEDIHKVAQLDIDSKKPVIELQDITTSNVGYTNYANHTHLVSGHIKLTEKNIIRNDLSQNTIQIQVNSSTIMPNIKTFSLTSETQTYKIYEFSFINCTGDGELKIIIPKGTVEDKSGLVNDETIFSTNITIDNTPPIATFEEIPSESQKSIAKFTINESIRPVLAWSLSNNNCTLTKEFSHYISYALPIMDYAQNSAEGIVDIKNATNILLQYGTYDDYSKYTLVTGGDKSAPDIINSGSICKSEAMYVRLSGDIGSTILQGKAYVYTHWGEGSYGVCDYSELTYYYGYNPKANSEWYNIGTGNPIWYHKERFTQFGGVGLNRANTYGFGGTYKPLTSEVAKQYLYGISSIKFRFNTNCDYSIVYQSYVKDIGWLPVSSDGEENLYQHDKPITTFRMNLVPKSEKQYLVDYWNRDVSK